MSAMKQESKEMDGMLVGWGILLLCTRSPEHYSRGLRLFVSCQCILFMCHPKNPSVCIHPSVLHPTPTKADGEGLASNLVVQHILQRGSCAPSQANVAGIGDARFPSSASHYLIKY